MITNHIKNEFFIQLNFRNCSRNISCDVVDLSTNDTWQNTITAQYQDKKIIHKQYKDVFQAVIGALNYCNFAIQKKNYRKGYITAQTSWTMKSFGEHITIKMKENTQGTYVAFRSKCKLETQLFDWGKNKQNTQKFFKVLKTIL